MHARFPLPAEAPVPLYEDAPWRQRILLFLNGAWQHYDRLRITPVVAMHPEDPAWAGRWQAIWPLKDFWPIGRLTLYLAAGTVRTVDYPDFREFYPTLTDWNGQPMLGRLDPATNRRYRRTCWRLRETGADPQTHVIIFDREDHAYQWLTVDEYNRRARSANAAFLRSGAGALYGGDRPPSGLILPGG